jgi:hypothetical protein
LEGETESEIRAAQEQALKENIMQQKHYEQKQQMQTMSTVICGNGTHKISMPSIGKIIVHKEDIFCMLNYPLNMCNVIGVKTNNKHGRTMCHNQ